MPDVPATAQDILAATVVRAAIIAADARKDAGDLTASYPDVAAAAGQLAAAAQRVNDLISQHLNPQNPHDRVSDVR